MKNNAALRLAKAALACALFGTMFTSCSKEEDILPLSQVAVLTDDHREERINGKAIEDKKVQLEKQNNEQSRLAGDPENSTGHELTLKCTKEKCGFIKVHTESGGTESIQDFSVRRRNIDSNIAAK